MKSSLLPFALASSVLLMSVECSRNQEVECIENRKSQIIDVNSDTDVLQRKYEFLREKLDEIYVISQENHAMLMEILNDTENELEEFEDYDLNDERCGLHYCLLENDLNHEEYQGKDDEYEDCNLILQEEGVDLDSDVPVDEDLQTIKLEQVRVFHNIQDVDIEEEDSE